MGLAACIIITLLGMVFIPASPADTVAFTKMIVAIILVVLAWVLFAVGGGHLAL
jgi:lipopolysaccharide export LptBFGC system permease protein LptF